jgi:uncharacterized membrane protein
VNNKTYTALLAGSTLWCLSIIAAPLTGSAAVYSFFAVICHQDPARSWHFLGEPLPVCIRCASIYFGFLAALWLRISPRTRWLRIAIALMICEFVMARLVVDAAIVRSVSGILFGLTAAPFVRRGIEEMTGESM